MNKSLIITIPIFVFFTSLVFAQAPYIIENQPSADWAAPSTPNQANQNTSPVSQPSNQNKTAANINLLKIITQLNSDIKSFYWQNPYPQNIQYDYLKNNKNSLPIGLINNNGSLEAGYSNLVILNKLLLKDNYGYEIRINNLSPGSCHNLVANLNTIFPLIEVNGIVVKNTTTSIQQNLSTDILMQSCSHEVNIIGFSNL